MAKKKEAEKLFTISAAVPVLVCKANRPLSEAQHEALARKLEVEQERTGVKVLLVPHSADVTVDAEIEETVEESGKTEETTEGAENE